MLIGFLPKLHPLFLSLNVSLAPPSICFQGSHLSTLKSVLLRCDFFIYVRGIMIWKK